MADVRPAMADTSNQPEDSPPPRISLPYPHVISVSHSNFKGIPRGITALQETPVLYIESETTIENSRSNFFYNIVDAFGRRLYIAQETSHRSGECRPFLITIKDSDGQVVFTIRRPHTCRLFCFGSKIKGVNVTTVSHPGGLKIGEIRQYSGPQLKYDILNEKGQNIMKVICSSKRHWIFGHVAHDAKVELFLDQVHPIELVVPPSSAPPPIQPMQPPPPPPPQTQTQPQPPPPLPPVPDQKKDNQDPGKQPQSESNAGPGQQQQKNSAPDAQRRSGPPPIGSFNVITSSEGDNVAAGCVFGLQFPLMLTPEVKALILSAGFLIDFSFCQTKSSKCITWYGFGFLVAISLISLALVGLFMFLYLNFAFV